MDPDPIKKVTDPVGQKSTDPDPHLEIKLILKGYIFST